MQKYTKIVPHPFTVGVVNRIDAQRIAAERAALAAIARHAERLGEHERAILRAVYADVLRAVRESRPEDAGR